MNQDQRQIDDYSYRFKERNRWKDGYTKRFKEQNRQIDKQMQGSIFIKND